MCSDKCVRANVFGLRCFLVILMALPLRALKEPLVIFIGSSLGLSIALANGGLMPFER